MAKSYESDEEVTSSNNNLSICFDELQDAFAELHSESIKLAKLKNEVSISKSSDKDYVSTIPDEKVISNSCNYCSKYEKEIKDLKNSLAKFSIGRNNLDVILGKQRCVFDKAGIGYKPEKQ